MKRILIINRKMSEAYIGEPILSRSNQNKEIKIDYFAGEVRWKGKLNEGLLNYDIYFVCLEDIDAESLRALRKKYPESKIYGMSSDKKITTFNELLDGCFSVEFPNEINGLDKLLK